jgi:hypothetical protein
MNKGITLLISLVVLAAMGLVMFFHIGGKQAPGQPSFPVAEQRGESRQSGFASPLHAPQGDTGELRSIEPPISNSLPPSSPQARSEGSPQPVRLTPSFDGNPPQPVALPQPFGTDNSRASDTEPPADKTPISAAAASPGAAQPVPAKESNTPPASGAVSAEKPVTGSPGLTPWTNPPEEATAAQPQSKPQEAPAARQQSKPQAAPASGTHSLRNISLHFAGQGMVLQIEAEAPFPSSAFVLTGPDRLVVDLPGSWKGMRKPSVPENRLIKDARLGQQPSGPRLVLDLANPIKGHTIERSGNTTRIILQ